MSKTGIIKVTLMLMIFSVCACFFICNDVYAEIRQPNKKEHRDGFTVYEYEFYMKAEKKGEGEDSAEGDLTIDVTGADKARVYTSNVITCRYSDCMQYSTREAYLTITDENGSVTIDNSQILSTDLAALGYGEVSLHGRTYVNNQPCEVCHGKHFSRMEFTSAMVYYYDSVVEMQPSSISMEVGGSGNLSASAKYAKECKWQIKLGDSYIDISDGEMADGTVFSGSDSGELYISNAGYAVNNTSLRCRFKNLLGVETYTDEVSMKVEDLNGPIVNITKSESNYTPNNVTIYVDACDSGCGLAKLPFSYDGGYTYTDKNKYEVKSNCSIDVAVRDMLGNVTKQTVVVDNIDKVEPEMDLTYDPPSGATEKVTVTITASDAGSGLADEPYFYGGKWNADPVVTLTTNGSYTYKVIDKAGNENSRTVRISNITVKKTPAEEKSNTENDANPSDKADTEAKPGGETKPDTETKQDTETKPGGETKQDTGTKPGSETKQDTDTKPSTNTQATNTKPSTQNPSQTTSKPASNSTDKKNSQTNTDTKPVIKSEGNTDTKSEIKVETKPESKTANENEKVPVKNADEKKNVQVSTKTAEKQIENEIEKKTEVKKNTNSTSSSTNVSVPDTILEISSPSVDYMPSVGAASASAASTKTASSGKESTQGKVTKTSGAGNDKAVPVNEISAGGKMTVQSDLKNSNGQDREKKVSSLIASYGDNASENGSGENLEKQVEFKENEKLYEENTVEGEIETSEDSGLSAENEVYDLDMAKVYESEGINPVWIAILIIIGIILLLILLCVLFFVVYVEYLDNETKLWKFCGLSVVYYFSKTWNLPLAHVLNEHQMVRLRFGPLFPLIFEGFSIRIKTGADEQDYLTEDITQGLIVNLRKIRRR